MSRRDDDFHFSGDQIGFFRSLTPLSYILAGSVLAALLLTAGFMLWGGDDPPDTASSPAPPGRERITVSEDRVEPQSQNKGVRKDTSVARDVPESVGEGKDNEGWTVPPTRLPPQEKEDNVAQAEVAGDPHEAPPAIPPADPVAPENKAAISPSKPETATPQRSAETVAWIVQLSANRRADLAAEWAGRVNDLGLDVTAYVIKRQMDDTLLHVLRMGGFASESEAQSMAREVASQLGLKGGIVRRARPEDLEQLAR